eukprot:TRINITY_DN1479_c1_g1_i1.p1 TRINITY_DN1479_c1_g1~~TRINITY_DN1479_c1_g1_i1.p1  ORF type:complete len:140 (+),score=37.65 TRINITY_DN1479_c1_g1_i1:58-420(+)
MSLPRSLSRFSVSSLSRSLALNFKHVGVQENQTKHINQRSIGGSHFVKGLSNISANGIELFGSQINQIGVLNQRRSSEDKGRDIGGISLSVEKISGFGHQLQKMGHLYFLLLLSLFDDGV